MRNELHTRYAPKLLAALLTAVLVPAAVLFSLEEASSREAEPRTEVVVSMPVSRVAPKAIDWTGDWGDEWTGEAAQSASMVVVGTLLIGIGSIVRRSVNS